MWEEMNGKPLAETSGDVVPNDAPDGGGHTDGAQFGRIIWVFVRAEEVGIAEVGTDGMGKLICEDGIEEELKVCIYGWVVKFAEEGDVNMQERTLLLSSMNVVMMETEQKLSSPKSPARTRCLARWLFSAACRGART